MADNAAGAQLVSQNLGMDKEHCTAHVLVIPATRTLVKPQYEPKKKVRILPAPAELEAMEVARLWAMFFYHSEDKQKLWTDERQRQGLSADQAPLPKPDTSKWDSKLYLAHSMVRGRDIFQKLCNASKDIRWTLPTIPSDEHFKLYGEIAEVLKLLEATLNQLQGDEAPLAIYVPVVAAMKGVLRKLTSNYAAIFLKELIECEHRNFDIPLSPAKSKNSGGWSTFRELMETCSLAHPLYRNGLYFNAEVREQRRLQFKRHCLAMYMKTNNIDNDMAPVQIVPPCPCAKQPATKKRKLDGAAALFAELESMNGWSTAAQVEEHIDEPKAAQSTLDEGVRVKIRGIISPEHQHINGKNGICLAFSNGRWEVALEDDGLRVRLLPGALVVHEDQQPSVTSRPLKMEVYHQASTWMAGPPDSRPWKEVMKSPSTKQLIGLLGPGMRDLLRRESSNGLGERIFGMLARQLSKFNKEIDAELYLGCRITTKFIPCEGFASATLEDGSADEVQQGWLHTVPCHAYRAMHTV